ncbi:hypothetical protein M434DRAFT_397375 [Hypoxylon sp. CO27-5]|nr:hypothetical protein M434DRAFT_397375 [Hypoxylon sp. CO27-5]
MGNDKYPLHRHAECSTRKEAKAGAADVSSPEPGASRDVSKRIVRDLTFDAILPGILVGGCFPGFGASVDA